MLKTALPNPITNFDNLAPNDHNPDVLACLANLSNDEVFTPFDEPSEVCAA